jgi:hypothetical protein
VVQQNTRCHDVKSQSTMPIPCRLRLVSSAMAKGISSRRVQTTRVKVSTQMEVAANYVVITHILRGTVGCGNEVRTHCIIDFTGKLTRLCQTTLTIRSCWEWAARLGRTRMISTHSNVAIPNSIETRNRKRRSNGHSTSRQGHILELSSHLASPRYPLPKK